jgi:GNAT superfamily N-acetyltransferase
MPFVARPATRADLPGLAAALAAAFVDDPVKQFLTGRLHLPVERAAPFFDAFTRIHWAHGLADVGQVAGEAAGAAEGVAGQIAGAAVWARPDHWKVPTLQVVRWAPRFVRMYGRRFLPNLHVLRAVEEQHPREPHYYLEFLGIRPEHQGFGLGRALIEPMTARADREGVGMYLENSKEKNLAFYGRHGFQPRAVFDLPGGGPPVWLMWREPR